MADLRKGNRFYIFAIWLAIWFTEKAETCTLLTATEDTQFMLSHTLYGIQQYHNSIHKCWEILTEQSDLTIELRVEEFSVEEGDTCMFDYVVIYDGLYDQSSEVGRYCGDGFQGTIESSGDIIYVEFVTDESSTQDGFKLAYKAVESRRVLSPAMIILVSVLSALGLALVITAIFVCIVCIVKKKNRKINKVSFTETINQPKNPAPTIWTGTQYTSSKAIYGHQQQQGTSLAVAEFNGVPPPAIYHSPETQRRLSVQSSKIYTDKLQHHSVLPPLV